MIDEAIRTILGDKIINMSELVRRVNRKGLSVPSLYNKLNTNHAHKFKEDELKAIEKELRKIADFINKGLHYK